MPHQPKLIKAISNVLDYQYIKKNKRTRADAVLLERGVRFLKNTNSFFLKLGFELMQIAEQLSDEATLRELKQIYISKLKKRKRAGLVNFLRNKTDYWELPRACFRVLDVESGEKYLGQTSGTRRKAGCNEYQVHDGSSKLLSKSCKKANNIFFAENLIDRQSISVFIPPSIFLPNKKYPGFAFYQKQIIELILKYFDDRNINFIPLLQLSAKSPSIHQLEKYIAMHTIDDLKSGLHWKEHDRPYRFRFDPRGYAGWSNLALQSLADLPLEEIDQKIADDYFHQKQLQFASGATESKYCQQVQWDLPQELRDYIFVPLQLPDDTVQEHAYISLCDMLEMLVEFGSKTGVLVVVKRHPHCRSHQIKNLLSRLTRNNACVETRASIHLLIPRAAAVCTVNSTVGIEALSYYKPLYTFGHCDYHHATHVVKTFQDFTSLFSKNKPALEPAVHRKYIYFYDNDNLVDLRAEPEKSLEKILSRWISSIA